MINFLNRNIDCLYYVQSLGLMILFLECWSVKEKHKLRYSFPILGMVVFFLWIGHLAQVFLQYFPEVHALTFLFRLSLLLSCLSYFLFFYFSSQGKNEKRIALIITISFLAYNLFLLRLYPLDGFYGQLFISIPIFIVITFQFFLNRDLLVHRIDKKYIKSWTASFILLFLILSFLRLFQQTPILLYNISSQSFFVFVGNLLLILFLFLCIFHLWHLIKWVNGIKQVFHETLMKLLLIFFILFSVFLLLFTGPYDQETRFIYIISFYFVIILILFFTYLEVKNSIQNKNLRLSEFKFRKFVENNPRCIGLLDNEGLLIQINEAGEQILNISMTSVIHKSFDQLIGKNDPVWLSTVLRSVLKKNCLSFEYELHLEHEQKKIVDILLYLLPLDDEDINYQFVFMILNITEKKEMEILKDSLISMVSHELRTPLTSIHESLQLLQKNEERSDFKELRENIVNIALRNTDRMSELISKILKMEKISSGKYPYKFIKNNIHKVLREVYHEYLPMAQTKNLAIHLNFKARNEEILFDYFSIKEVIANLIGNAIKFTETGTITLGSYTLKNEVVIFVEDTGIGIREEDIDKIFLPFCQIESTAISKQDGTGLGLSICKSIITDHNGQIYVNSIFGKGSKFLFTLPD